VKFLHTPTEEEAVLMRPGGTVTELIAWFKEGRK
jgi:hypothetical protein